VIESNLQVVSSLSDSLSNRTVRFQKPSTSSVAGRSANNLSDGKCKRWLKEIARSVIDERCPPRSSSVGPCKRLSLLKSYLQIIRFYRLLRFRRNLVHQSARANSHCHTVAGLSIRVFRSKWKFHNSMCCVQIFFGNPFWKNKSQINGVVILVSTAKKSFGSAFREVRKIIFPQCLNRVLGKPFPCVA
jgi:hypothetical protein